MWWSRATKGDRTNKLDAVGVDGCAAGYRALGGETSVSIREGIIRTRIVRRVPEHIRSDPNIFAGFVYVPWNVNLELIASLLFITMKPVLGITSVKIPEPPPPPLHPLSTLSHHGDLRIFKYV